MMGGLKPPQAVQQATAEYFEAEDSFGLWFDERCEKTTNAWESSSALFNSYKDWAESRGERVGTAKRLAQSLETKGFVKRERTRPVGSLAFGFLKPPKHSFLLLKRPKHSFLQHTWISRE
jgi:putative DNA primase/helicase